MVLATEPLCDHVTAMKRCVLDGSRLTDAASVYRALAGGFRFPEYFGNNPDALWDALGEYGGEPVEIVWRNAARSAELLGAHFEQIVAVLQKAAADGVLTLELA
jgi:RNAse (barnase) inhibitor barstar